MGYEGKYALILFIPSNVLMTFSSRYGLIRKRLILLIRSCNLYFQILYVLSKLVKQLTAQLTPESFQRYGQVIHF